MADHGLAVDDTLVSAGELKEADRLQQYEIVWVFPFQCQLLDWPEGFGLEIQDFLGPGDPDSRGKSTVWVRGSVVEVVSTSAGIRLFRGRLLNVAILHDQPRARRTGGAVLPPAVPVARDPWPRSLVRGPDAVRLNDMNQPHQEVHRLGREGT